jgi:ADP-ribose pyrophosphatase
MSNLSWKTVSKEYLYQETWLTVRKDRCTKPDGNEVYPYYVFEFPEWATALPITEDGKIILVKQYRHALGVTCIELPGGCIDDTDASPEAGVRRELLEETGYVFDNVIHLGETSPNPSTNSNLMHMYLATGGKKVAEQQLDANEEIQVFEVTMGELLQLLDEQKIVQSMHVTTILYALRKLGRLAYIPG